MDLTKPNCYYYTNHIIFSNFRLGRMTCGRGVVRETYTAHNVAGFRVYGIGLRLMQSLGLMTDECFRRDCLNMLNRRTWDNVHLKNHFESGVKMGVGAFNLVCIDSNFAIVSSAFQPR